MTPERLFNSFIPPKNFYTPKTNFWLRPWLCDGWARPTPLHAHSRVGHGLDSSKQGRNFVPKSGGYQFAYHLEVWERVGEVHEWVKYVLYGAETWSVTVILSRTIDALDNWCLRRILNIHWSEFVTNDD